MGAGVPVVATNVGGLSELITHGVTGSLAPAGDAKKLANALIELAENSAMRTEMARRAKCRAELEFSEHKMINGYARLFDDMLPEQPPLACGSIVTTGLRQSPRTEWHN
jgi:glycosyltransferase involved in cell wall biosynthesis